MSIFNQNPTNMRTITEIIIHCTATKEGQNYTAKDIERWHRALGWNGCGYHYIVRLDGTIDLGRTLSEIGAHTKGHNNHSIGVCYVGGLDGNGKPKDTRTEPQKKALRALLGLLCHAFPSATLHGHNEFAAKSCPCFLVSAEYGRHLAPIECELKFNA